MFFEKPFNIITTKDYENENAEVLIPTDKLRKDVACFHTFMLMNIINTINCRVVSEAQDNVFKTLFNNKIFWIVFLIEMLAQNGMIIAGYIKADALKWIPKLFGVCDVGWEIHLTAWIF